MLLKEKTVLVTGGSRGIGKAIVLHCARQGAIVGINYHRHEQEAQDTLAHIIKQGGTGLLLKGDVSQRQQVNDMIHLFTETHDHIDVLVHNAGIYQRATIGTLSSDQWRHTLSVNLDSCLYLVQAATPHIGKNGRIIFIASQLAFKGTPHGADYATSKAGMLGCMRSFALELAPRDITVNAIAPGTIDTDLIAGYTEKQRRQRAQEIPLGRIGTPDDIAQVCVFLASELSGYITGETINVNGGLYIH